MGGLTPFYWWGNQGSKGEDSYPSANCQGRIQGLCDSKVPAFQWGGDTEAGDDQLQGTTWLDTDNPDMGFGPRELRGCGGVGGGGLNNDPIKCRPCHHRGYTATQELRGDREGRLPGGGDVWTELCDEHPFSKKMGAHLVQGSIWKWAALWGSVLSSPLSLTHPPSTAESKSTVVAPNVPLTSSPVFVPPSLQEIFRLHHPYHRTSSLWLGKELFWPSQLLAMGLHQRRKKISRFGARV